MHYYYSAQYLNKNFYDAFVCPVTICKLKDYVLNLFVNIFLYAMPGFV